MTRSLHNFRQENDERGVALLFVILLTSVLLLVCIGITNVAYKEASFSIEAKDSNRAFFAADTGIECGLMLDAHGNFGGTPVGPIVCAGYTPTLVDSGGGSYVFAIPLGTECSVISINKDYPYDDGTGVHSYTQISALGYNVPADPLALPSSCITGTPGPKVITRALGTRYLNPTTGGGTSGGGSTGGGTSGGTSSG